MNKMNINEIRKTICSTLCADVDVVERGEGLLFVSTPFSFSDGDAYSIYLKSLPTGGFRITDMGGTLMHLSYENDTDKFREGMRGKVFNQILSEMNLGEDDGEFYIDTAADALGSGLFRFGQAITRLHDLTFLNRVRVESTFYEDLRENLRNHVDAERIHEGYIVPGVANARDYPVDYFIEGGNMPLYLFGVPNRDKARLATIILQHLIAAGRDFNSMVVFQNASDVPSRDLSRLMNAANDMIASLDASDDFERKLLRRVK
ncbi:MAG: hypothetical protein CO125_12580 [Hydrogenophilales bacterium CG_4_9_14_3_um_filter_59_35]|nr:MAG: hypothetical protein COW70_00930 [Hydrogenophilales bacterium CG18_big_fil_WC_8_21_14_2_50_58_12]PIY01293.1 MAG: hypothetical protein COZ23_03940 [Hydrogenophilales bacterium CG_4_10_14_3_um_filter_58_23]PJB03827.1 MAG: hypothetical protein CO125_12580 [Hydrogenophilales bacterium CG_4_9_14_3_um_filter_59_35]